MLRPLAVILSVISATSAFAIAPVDTSNQLIISVRDQKLMLLRNGGKVATYPISTSMFGLGDSWGRMTTPLGYLAVEKKIGDNVPVGAVFHNRRLTGEVLQPERSWPRPHYYAHHLAARPRGAERARVSTLYLYSWNAGGKKDRSSRKLRLHPHEIEGCRRPLCASARRCGALAVGLAAAEGEFLCILDADFVPEKDLLKRTVHFFTDPKVGMIQTRWGHLNRGYSLLTRMQAIFLDGHLLLEQIARSRSGRFFNFNGTAGLWRRSCIEQSGGWQHDTLCEDLDLSYRAQLAGWKFIYLSDVVTPAELPVDMNGFKSQQHRWTKGSVQTCKKLLPSVWRSQLPFRIKLEATGHLMSNFAYLLLAMLCVLLYPATGGPPVGWVRTLLVDIPIFLAASASVGLFYICAQRELHPRNMDQRTPFSAMFACIRNWSLAQQRASSARSDD